MSKKDLRNVADALADIEDLIDAIRPFADKGLIRKLVRAVGVLDSWQLKVGRQAHG